MASVWVTGLSKEWAYEKDMLLVVYHLSNGRRVHIYVHREYILQMGQQLMTEVITHFSGTVNKQLNAGIPETLGQYKTFQKFLQDELQVIIDQYLYDKNKTYPKLVHANHAPLATTKGKTIHEWGISPNVDNLAPHEERQPRVLHLIDLGDGMLVPKGFVEMILNDVPLAGVASYVDDFVKEKPDPEKYFKQIMKPALVDKGFYQSQYMGSFDVKKPFPPPDYTVSKGPQPGPDKKYIPENHKPAPHNPFKL